MNIKADIQDVRIISRHPSYHGWPTIGKGRNDELFVASSSGRQEHVCPYGQLHLIRSRDCGKTWSDPQILADTGCDDRDAGVIVLADGSILVNWFNSLAWMHYLYRAETGQIEWMPKETQDRWRVERQWLVDNVKVRDELGDWLIISKDDGKTWSKRIPTLVNSPHGPIQLRDGRLMYVGKRTGPPVTWVRGSAHEANDLAVAESLDGGFTWSVVGSIPCAPGHEPKDHHEPHMVETADGKLIAQIREPIDRETYQTESTDCGRTWTVPHRIGVWGQPSHLVRLKNGMLLMTYGYRREPFGNQARFSDDSGTTWSEPVTISADGAGPDLGYPSSVELSDGRIISVWYEHFKDKPLAVIRQATWTWRKA